MPDVVILACSYNSRNENQNIGYFRLLSITDANGCGVPGTLERVLKDLV